MGLADRGPSIRPFVWAEVDVTSDLLPNTAALMLTGSEAFLAISRYCTLIFLGHIVTGCDLHALDSHYDKQEQHGSPPELSHNALGLLGPALMWAYRM